MANKLKYICAKCKCLHNAQTNGVYEKLRKAKFFVNTTCNKCNTDLQVYIQTDRSLYAEIKNKPKNAL